jgi:hypothetical protein
MIQRVGETKRRKGATAVKYDTESKNEKRSLSCDEILDSISIFLIMIGGIVLDRNRKHSSRP